MTGGIEPGFHHEARYEFKVHFGAAEMEELTYRVTFGEPDAQGGQPLTCTRSPAPTRATTLPSAPARPGPHRHEATGEHVRIWAGASLTPSTSTSTSSRPSTTPSRTAPRWTCQRLEAGNAKNNFADTTVDAIVLEVSDELACWARALDRRLGGHQTRHRRRGMAADQPRRAPDDVADLLAHRHGFTNPANTRHPCEDLAADGEDIARRGPGGRRERHRADPQATAGTWPGVLTRTCCPTSRDPGDYGFAARNGRTGRQRARVMFSLVINTGMTSGLTPDITKEARADSFPYVVPA